jgi:hypothetical protein
LGAEKAPLNHFCGAFFASNSNVVCSACIKDLIDAEQRLLSLIYKGYFLYDVTFVLLAFVFFIKCRKQIKNGFLLYETKMTTKSGSRGIELLYGEVKVRCLTT